MTKKRPSLNESVLAPGGVVWFPVQDVTVGDGVGKRLGVKEDVKTITACQPQGDSAGLGVPPRGVK